MPDARERAEKAREDIDLIGFIIFSFSMITKVRGSTSMSRLELSKPLDPVMCSELLALLAGA